MGRSLVFLAVTLLGCDRRATDAECNEMLERYVDMEIGSDPALSTLPPVEANATREARLTASKADPAYRAARQKCETEVSRHEYRCAIKAPNKDMWQACID